MGEPEKKPDVALAFLHMPRQTCVGCAEYLRERGILEVIGEGVLPASGGADPVLVRHYRMKPDVTLQQCQEAVRHRHRGPRPWGID